MFFKKEKEKSVIPCIGAAKEIAKKYDELSNCCKILAEVFPASGGKTYSEGWRIWEHTVKNAGIDIEEVYAFIGELAQKRKAEIECSLASVGR